MIIGIVCDFVMSPTHEEWIGNKIDEIIERGKLKDASFITPSLEGLSVVIIKKLTEQKVGFFVTSRFGGYNFPSAICTFKADIEFMTELADYVVIISNGQKHTQWEKIRNSGVGVFEINYLLKNEKFIKGE